MYINGKYAKFNFSQTNVRIWPTNLKYLMDKRQSPGSKLFGVTGEYKKAEDQEHSLLHNMFSINYFTDKNTLKK